MANSCEISRRKVGGRRQESGGRRQEVRERKGERANGDRVKWTG
ncbi:hypothetical protein V0288_14875 [Pannus brasiliensis CCIBt3594]|uniref:Uncharacterized protein n=1 Tax=Pannus brasiliensis CCIBt3594 TaxID=1427578 RepID=A0AAW9QW59_9CHRO